MDRREIEADIAEKQLRIRQLQVDAALRWHENRLAIWQIALIVFGGATGCFIAGAVLAKLFM